MKRLLCFISCATAFGIAQAQTEKFDLDKSGSVGVNDVCALVNGLVTSSTSLSMDMNQDGRVDLKDVSCMATYVLCFAGQTYEYVDLGLPSGTKWATTNLGSSTVSGAGIRLAWGELQTKTDYTWSNYALAKGTSTSLTKYCTSKENGMVDNVRSLKNTNDAVSIYLTGQQRMPAHNEVEELCSTSNTTTTATQQNGVDGLLVKSKKNGNTIFLPYGSYWTGTLYANSDAKAYVLNVSSSGLSYTNSERCEGLSVRPVMANENDIPIGGGGAPD